MIADETLGELQVRLRKLKRDLAITRNCEGEPDWILVQIQECEAEIFQRRGGEPSEADESKYKSDGYM